MTPITSVSRLFRVFPS